MYTVYLSGGPPHWSDEFIEGNELRVLNFENPNSIDVSDNLVVQERLARLRESDILVARMDDLTDVDTPMEIVYAKAMDMSVIVISTAHNPSPWVRYHADALVDSDEEARESLAENL